MRTALAALALAVAPAAFAADLTQPVQAAGTASLAAGYAGKGHIERMYSRYCEKLREGPEAYAAFVKRMNTVTGYTFTEFAPNEPTDVVRHNCREPGAAVAAREQRGG